MDKISPNSNIYSYSKLFVYFIFLYSGLIKWIPFPIDYTLFTGLILLCFMLVDIKHLKFKVAKNVETIYVIFYVFSLLYISSITYSISTNYAEIKARGFILNVLAFTFPIVSIRLEHCKKIIVVMSVLCVFMLSFLAFLYLNDLFIMFIMPDEEQINLFGVVIPTYLDIGTFIAVAFLLNLHTKSKTSLILKILIFYFLILLEGRGPLLVLILVVIIDFWLKNRKISNYVKYLIVLIFAISLYLYLDLDFIDFDRLNIFESSKFDVASRDRYQYINKCLEGFYNSPIFGNGIGSSGILISNHDVVLYPHNSFVEVLAELGIIGFIMYLLIYVLYLKLILFKKIPTEVMPFLLIAFYMFFQDMKSGAFEGWRISCGWLSIAIIIAYSVVKASNTSNKKLA